MELFRRCEKFILENSLIKKGDKILIALSGGADSTFLLYLFSSMKRRYLLDISAIYVDHNIRKRVEIEGELRIIKENCAKTSIPLIVEKIDDSLKGSEEELRDKRYKILYEFSSKLDSKIATGHTSSDQVETFFLRFQLN